MLSTAIRYYGESADRTFIVRKDILVLVIGRRVVPDV